jgi:YidC/Oxa1 family membrane protein insertase
MIPFLSAMSIKIMDNQRLLLYLSLVFVLFLIWQTWQEQHAPKIVADSRSTTEIDSGVTAAGELPTETTESPDVPEAAEIVPEQAVSHEEGGTRIKVTTDTLEVDIALKGGSVLRVDLLTFPESFQTPDVPFRLMSDQPPDVYIAQSGLVHDRIPGSTVDHLSLAPSHHAIYTSEKNEYRLADGENELKVPLTWKSTNGTTVKKLFTFRRDSFLVDVDHVIINDGKDPWVGRQYRQLRHGEINEENQSRFLYTYTGTAFFDGKYEKLPFDDMADEPLKKDLAGGWIAILQHYFVSAWVPGADENNQVYSKVINGYRGPEYIIGLRSASQNVALGETGSFNSKLFVGPKLQNQLSETAEGLELVTDYGIFTVISKPLFWLLELFHSWLGNWGWAIIVLTVLIKLVFYKLSETSYRSMAKMRAVQPRLLSLKERYANDKQKMNQALMELYKKEKINPLGGCLPILIQIPVFIALYWALLESVELRQAPFILWIKDLSTKDPFFVLPVLMGVTMVAQQKLNPTPLDPIQAKLMMILPLVFTVFFAFFPSGLVLYWFVNNLLSIAQQWMITRRIEKLAH